MRCPEHPRELAKADQGLACPGCRGVLSSEAELDAAFPGATALLATEARALPHLRRAPACPSCAAPLSALRIAALEAWVWRCGACELTWVPPQSQRVLAAQVKRARLASAWQSFSPEERAEMANDLAAEARPAERVESVSAADVAKAAAGVPIVEGGEGDQAPWAARAMTAVVVAVFLLGLAAPESFGFDALAWRTGDGVGASLFTAVFAHAGWAHALFNAAFLLVFGGVVEQKVSRAAWGALFLGAGVASIAAAALLEEGPYVVGGASGAVSALMAAAAVLQPRARLKVLLFSLRAIAWSGGIPAFSVPLWVGVGLDALKQVLFWNLGVPGVAWSAHVAGLALGAGAGIALRRRG